MKGDMDKKFQEYLEDLKEKNHVNEDGTREGLYESFYENGEVESRLTFKNGLYHGLQEWFTEEGEIISQIVFLEGEEWIPEYVFETMREPPDDLLDEDVDLLDEWISSVEKKTKQKMDESLSKIKKLLK